MPYLFHNKTEKIWSPRLKNISPEVAFIEVAPDKKFNDYNYVYTDFVKDQNYSIIDNKIIFSEQVAAADQPEASMPEIKNLGFKYNLRITWDNLNNESDKDFKTLQVLKNWCYINKKVFYDIETEGEVDFVVIYLNNILPKHLDFIKSRTDILTLTEF